MPLGDAALLHSQWRAGLIRHREAMLGVARRRRTWTVEGIDGRTAHIHVRAEPTRAVHAMKGIMSDDGRATVIVGFGHEVEEAQFFALTVPDAYELVRMLQHGARRAIAAFGDVVIVSARSGRSRTRGRRPGT